MQPDLITVCVGMNDVTRPGRLFDRAVADLEHIYSRLVDCEATVVTTTFPDIAQLVPVGRLLASRVLRINEVIVTAANRYGFRLVDLYNAASMKDPETWSADGIHASTKGHILFAAAAAEALNLPTSNHDWAQASCSSMRSLSARASAQLRWTQNMLVPWIWRQLRGRSTGEGQVPKRPRLESLTAQCRSQH
jgi:lysophospholipase L1-like esterase